MDNTAPPQPQLLRRNTREGRIAGVAAGLGDYFRVDPVVVRLTLVLLVLAGGFGLLVYLLAWLVIPPGDETQRVAPTLQRRLPPSRRNLRSVLGGLVLAIGVLAFLATAGSWWLPEIEAWPLILIAIGAGLLLLRARRGDSTPPASGPEEPVAPEPGDGEPEPADTAPLDEDDVEEGAEDAPVDDADVGADEETTAQHEVVSAYSAATLATDRSRVATARRLPVAWVTLGAIIVSGAIAALLDLTGALTVSTRAFLLLALALAGLGIVASAFLGRRIAIVGLAGVIAVGLAVVSVPGTLSLESGAGERIVQPTSLAEVEPRYELGAGKLTLDLRNVEPSGGQAVIEADVGVGELIVLFPPESGGRIEARTTIGEVELFGRSDSGVSVFRSASIGPEPLDPLIVVDAEVGIGRLEARLATTASSASAHIDLPNDSTEPSSSVSLCDHVLRADRRADKPQLLYGVGSRESASGSADGLGPQSSYLCADPGLRLGHGDAHAAD